MIIYLQDIGFDTAENEPPNVCTKECIDPPSGSDLPNKYLSGRWNALFVGTCSSFIDIIRRRYETVQQGKAESYVCSYST